MVEEMVSKPHVNPLRFMWIAHFNDGTSLPEFDPFLFKVHPMGEVFERSDNLIKFGLYPIPPTLANELNKRKIETVVSIPFFPRYEINLEGDKRLIFYRRNFIHNETYHKCSKCNKEFHASPKISSTESIQPSYICPSCGAYDIFICKKCKKEYNLIEDAPGYMCSCGSYLGRTKTTSKQYGRERRVREHHIGYQETVKGVNKKSILKIDQEGNVEVIYK